jgi:hypothetical protein
LYGKKPSSGPVFVLFMYVDFLAATCISSSIYIAELWAARRRNASMFASAHDCSSRPLELNLILRDLPNPNDPVLLVHANGTDDTVNFSPLTFLLAKKSNNGVQVASRAYSGISAHTLPHNNANLCDMRTWLDLDRRLFPESTLMVCTLRLINSGITCIQIAINTNVCRRDSSVACVLFIISNISSWGLFLTCELANPR